jgi:outer membrane immunogenic protein
MKKLTLALTTATALISAPALAADLGRMPVRAPVVAPVPIFNWSGCYIGVHGGGGFGEKEVFDPIIGATFGRHDTSGALVGGQVGCDFQTGAFVLGVEGSGSWADIGGDSLDQLGLGLRARSQIDFLGTFTGRIGWAWDRTLLYVKGGAAVADESYRVTCSTLVGACLGTGLVIGDTLARADETRWGWLIGAGLEWAFTPSWSLKLEYNFMDFGSERLNFALAGGGTVPFDIDQHVHVIKAGINWRFNFGGPVVASY